MKRKVFSFVLLVLLLTSVVAVASAHGLSSDRLERQGWTCFAIPEVHCVPPSVAFPDDLLSDNPPMAVNVMVFSADGHDFLGAELLLHEDVYNGQDCMTDGGHTYHYLGSPPYYACHHYDTSS